MDSPSQPQFVVIVRTQEQRLALTVDDLIGQRELVTRPLPAAVSGEPVSGGAALADGRIALIVDCDALGTYTPKPVRTGPARPPSANASSVTGNGRVAA
jgi:chemotaxis protein histidine kinase CheA